MPRKYKYHQDCPKGEIFDISDAEEKELNEAGWVDTPALLDLPEEKPEISPEVAESLSPGDLVAKCRELGYIVLTPDELEAEINKAVSEAVEADNAPVIDEDGEENEEQRRERVFFQNPTDLTKEELKQYADERYSLSLSMNMKEATMIEKITEAKAEADQE